MPQRNIDLLQDQWAAAGRYSRQPSPETQRLIDEMFPPLTPHPDVQRTHRTPGGYSNRYLNDIGEKILEAVGDQAMTREEIAKRLDLSPKYIGKALAAVAAEGHLVRSHSAPGRVSRYWKPQVAAGAA
jgi:predicted Rossmann fold nucleotide-binding protein DprA/Smf involved in DNA uptake